MGGADGVDGVIQGLVDDQVDQDARVHEREAE